MQVTEADDISEDTTTNVTSFKYHNLEEDEEEEEDCTIADCNDLDDYVGPAVDVPSFNVTPPSPGMMAAAGDQSCAKPMNSIRNQNQILAENLFRNRNRNQIITTASFEYQNHNRL